MAKEILLTSVPMTEIYTDLVAYGQKRRPLIDIIEVLCLLVILKFSSPLSIDNL